MTYWSYWDACYVCRQVYEPEEMGRCMLPLSPTSRRPAKLRAICIPCYKSLCDVLIEGSLQKAIPLLHGY